MVVRCFIVATFRHRWAAAGGGARARCRQKRKRKQSEMRARCVNRELIVARRYGEEKLARQEAGRAVLKMPRGAAAL